MADIYNADPSANVLTAVDDEAKLNHFLENETRNILEDWQQFEVKLLDKVFKKLINENLSEAQKKYEPLILDGKVIDFESFLKFFPQYLASESFFVHFNKWRQDKKLVPFPKENSPFIDFPQTYNLADFLGNEPPYIITEAFSVAQKIQLIKARLNELLSQEKADLPANEILYNQALAEALLTTKPNFVEELKKLDLSLTTEPEIVIPPEKYSELEKKFLESYSQQTGQALSDNDKQELTRAFKELANEQVKEFNKKSKDEWKKLVEAELSPPREASEIEAEFGVSNITGNFDAPGLLQLALDHKSESDLGEIEIDDNGQLELRSSKWLTAFFHHTRLSTSPITDDSKEKIAEIAETDFTKLLSKYSPALAKLIALIEDKKKKLAENLQKELLEALKSKAGIPSADDSDISGSEPDDTPATSPDVKLHQTIKIWQKVASRWREINSLSAGLVASLPAGYNLNVSNLANDDSIKAAVEERIQQGQSEDDLISSANQFLIQLEEIAISAGLSKTPEPPESVVPTDLEIPSTDQAEQADRETLAQPQSLNQLTRARQRMLEEVRKTLFDELLQHGLPEEEVQLLVHQYEGEISQDLWLKFIESGGLYQSLSAVQIIELWSGIADDYLDRIAIQKGFQDQNARSYYEQWQTDQQKIERRKIALEDNEFSLIAAAFSPENVSQAFSSLQPYLDPNNDEQWKDLAFSLFVQYYQNQGFDYADLEGQAKQLIDSVFFQLKTIRTTSKPDEFQAAYNSLLDLLLTGDEDWRLAFFQNEQLRAVLFSAPEILLAGTQLIEFSERWREAASKVAGKLTRKQLAVANYVNSLRLPGKSKDGQKPARLDYEAQIADELGRNVDLRFALNMVFTSGASTERQREIETALYIYFTLNGSRQIQLDYVMGLIYAGVMADENQAVEEMYREYFPPDQVDENAPPQAQAQANQALENYQEQALGAKHQQQKSLNASRSSANMRAAVGAAKVAAAALSGNWAKAAQELLTNKELQKKLKQAAQVVASYNAYMLFKILQGILKFFKTLYNIVTFPFKMGGAILKGAGHLIADGASWLARGASSIWKAGVNFFQGAFGLGSTAVGAEAAMEVESQLNALAKDATSISKQTGQGLVDAGSAPIKGFLQSATLAGVSSSLATVMAAAFLGPIFLVILITIIVITVIGGSMNDLPMGYVGESLTSFHGISGCWPVDGRITGRPEDHPAENVYGGYGTAFDIGLPVGSPVRAPFSGTAVSKYQAGGYGKYILLETDFGAGLIFAHLSESKIPGIGVSMKVEAGQVIGLSGRTGKSTGPHLHYESITPAYPIRNLIPSVPSPTNGTVISNTDCMATLGESPTAGGALPTSEPSGESVGETESEAETEDTATPAICRKEDDICGASSDCCANLECTGIVGVKTCRCPSGMIYESSLNMCIKSDGGSGFSAG